MRSGAVPGSALGGLVRPGGMEVTRSSECQLLLYAVFGLDLAAAAGRSEEATQRSSVGSPLPIPRLMARFGLSLSYGGNKGSPVLLSFLRANPENLHPRLKAEAAGSPKAASSTGAATGALLAGRCGPPVS